MTFKRVHQLGTYRECQSKETTRPGIGGSSIGDADELDNPYKGTVPEGELVARY